MTVEVIKSDLLEALPRFYSGALEVDGIMEANAIELDKFRAQTRLLLEQLTIVTANFGLSDWERVLALPRRPNRSPEYRRARIISKLLGSKPATVENMLAILNSHSAIKDGRIIELPEPGTVVFEVNASGGVDLNGLFEDIAIYIPAHLAYRIATATYAKTYLGSATQSGASITVYPYRVEAINTQSQASQGGATINAQKTTIYPRGDE